MSPLITRMNESPNRRIPEREVDRYLAALKHRLLASRRPDGCWTGHLSSSALSTAVALVALAQHDSVQHRSLIEGGLRWLADHVNADGGWGDTVRSDSNLSTTLLAWSAFSVLSETGTQFSGPEERAAQWITRETGSLDPATLAAAVVRHYGDDRTFSVPILTLLAICGRLGASPEAWRHVPPLPFELAILPQRLFRWLRLRVVSYALPALIGMGLARHTCGPRTAFCSHRLRHAVTAGVLRVLTRLQPANGGFLEAAPLTGFVVMSLCAAGWSRHAVAARGSRFLVQSVREDGSWPIDTNLATWLTSLSVAALSPETDLDLTGRGQIRDALLKQQFRTVHPFTGAAPGGWAWTDLPGGTPDADDTAATLLALHRLGGCDGSSSKAVAAGVRWLAGLQNRDGGIPTFCRGWGALPFDRSCPDITAHVVHAVDVWRDRLPPRDQRHVKRMLRRMLSYLVRNQRLDGAWVPLWFGNARAPRHENPVYGTARVLTGLAGMGERVHALCESGYGFLRCVQASDGGWGGDVGVAASIEETALAVSALLGDDDSASEAAAERGVQWLIRNLVLEEAPPAHPIGLYFASLWYYEKLYPLIFSIDAFRRYLENVSCVTRAGAVGSPGMSSREWVL